MEGNEDILMLILDKGHKTKSPKNICHVDLDVFCVLTTSLKHIIIGKNASGYVTTG